MSDTHDGSHYKAGKARSKAGTTWNTHPKYFEKHPWYDKATGKHIQ